jgi:transposase
MLYNTGMTKRKFKLTEQEAQALRARYATCPKGATRSRLQAVWMYGTGYPVGDIEKLVSCSRSSLMNWCRTYQTRGADGLGDDRLGGNNAKLTATQRADLKTRLQATTPARLFGPAAATPNGQFWTVADVQQAVAQWYGVTYRSATSYRQLLLTSGFSYQRPAKVFKSRKPSQVAEFEEAFEKKSSTSSKAPHTR